MSATLINLGKPTAYFPCSFSNDASFGEKSAPELRKLYGHRFDKLHIRNLKNNRDFSAMSMRSFPQDVREIWSGAFWEIREWLGQETADMLLFSAWVALRSSEALNDPSTHFAHKLLETAQSLPGGIQTDHIRVVLERHGLQFCIQDDGHSRAAVGGWGQVWNDAWCSRRRS
jgi:hypothetical protein